jgi:hypothetical protein
MARLGEFDEDAVLEAATQFFWKDGYEATSMRDLADHTGMTTPSLYNPLGNKRGASRIARPSIPRSPPLWNTEMRNHRRPLSLSAVAILECRASTLAWYYICAPIIHGTVSSLPTPSSSLLDFSPDATSISLR